MNFIKIFICLLFSLFVSKYYSQNIILQGFVLSKTTKEPIPYVNISVLNSTRGTTSNSEGEFKISIESNNKIKFSSIGFNDTSIFVQKPNLDFEIYLKERNYVLEEVVVSPYSWAEEFILEAVNENEKQKSQIKFYSALSYSKTSYSTKSIGLFAFIESISEISFYEPNKYKEKLLSLKLQPHIKNLPYEFIAVNQSINLLNDRSEFLQFSIINPLVQNTLDYYNVSLLKKLVSKNDTLVFLGIKPKYKNKPLFKGQLVFSASDKKIIEADLAGNEAVTNGNFDSLKVYQKFRNNFQKFNMPSFTKYSLIQNYVGLEIKQTQQYTFQNYDINNNNNVPYIALNNVVEEKLNNDYDLDFGRDEIFNVPLTKEEVQQQEKVNKKIIEASFFKKAILFTFVDLFPLAFDQPAEIFGNKVSNFSNIYRFNKIDGHYLGYEKHFINKNDLSIYGNLGYGFSSKKAYFSSLFKYRNVNLWIKKELKYLGQITGLKTFQSLNALFYHEDNYHYYNSFQFNSNIEYPLNAYFDLVFESNIEKTKPTQNNTDFSFFYKNLDYRENIKTEDYWNNYFALKLDFKTNYNYIQNKPQILKGKSFTNINGKVTFWDKKYYSSENLFSIDITLKSYFEVVSTIRLELAANYYKINKSNSIHKYRFTSKKNVLEETGSKLSFASIGNYYFTLIDYLYIESYLNLFDFPKFLNFRPSLGLFYTGVKSFDTPDIFVNKTLSKEMFYEYGVAIRGVSFLEFYFGLNNLKTKKVFLKIDFGL